MDDEVDLLDYEISLDDEFQEGQLQHGLQAMDIADTVEEGEIAEEGKQLQGTTQLAVVAVTSDSQGSINSPTYLALESGLADENIEGEGEEGNYLSHQANAGDKFHAGVTAKNEKHRKRKKKRRVNLNRFVMETCKRLQEPKRSLMWEAVHKLGMDVIVDLVHEVDAIEKCGGQMTADGSRRRSPGGVLWNILRKRVGPNVYKEIMTKGNELMKKAQKHHDNGKRRRMHVDDEPNNIGKRQKMEIDGTRSQISHKEPASTRGSRISWSMRTSPLELQTDGKFHAVDVLDVSVQAQKAWAEGVRVRERGEASTEAVAQLGVQSREADIPVMAPSLNTKLPVADRLRMPVSYGDLVEGEAEGCDKERHDNSPIDRLSIDEEGEIVEPSFGTDQSVRLLPSSV